MADVVVFGTGELGRLARLYIDRDSQHRVVAFSLDESYLDGAHSFGGLPLVPFEQIQEKYPPDEVSLFVAVGYRRINHGRADAYRRARGAGYALLTYVSSRAIVAPEAVVGDNCFIFEGVIVQPFVTIGNDTIIWSGACIAHDTTIGEHCFIAPMASISGNVRIGDFTFIGNNATVRDGVAVAEATVVGAGALIKRDTKSGEVYAPQRSVAAEGKKSSALDTL